MNVLAAVSIAIASTNILWKTVDITCGKSIDMITSVVTKPVHGFNDLDEMLIEYDITCRLKHIRLLFKTLESKTYVETQSELINECLKDIKDAVEKVNESVEEINKSKIYQESLYLGTWRFRLPNCDVLLKHLRQNIHVFNERFNNLIMYTQLLHQMGDNESYVKPPAYHQ